VVISPVISPKVSHRVSQRLMVSQKSTTLRHALTGLTDLLQIGYKNTGKKGWKAVILRYEDEKSRPITSDFSIFYTKWHQLSPIGYFPMHYPYSIDSVLLELLLYKGRSHFWFLMIWGFPA